MGWKERVEKELDELEQKIRKLDDFINPTNRAYVVLDKTMQMLLISQLYAMKSYGAILETRLRHKGE